MNDSSRRIKAILCMLTAAFFFCFTEICLKKLNGAFNSVQLNLSRYLVAGLILLIPAVREYRVRGCHMTTQHLKDVMVLSFIGITLVGPFYQIASVSLGAGQTSIMFSSNPLFIALMASIILKERISHHQIAALVLQITAILVLINPFHMTLDRNGLVILAFSVFCYGLYAVLNKRLINIFGSVIATSAGFIAGGLQMLLIALLSHIPAVSTFFSSIGLTQYCNIPLFTGYSLENLPWILLLYLGVTTTAFLCWFKAMELGSTSLGSITYFIKPALSPVLAFLLLGEALNLRIVIGIILMLTGAAVGLCKDKEDKPSSSSAS